ncbi:hypothetical protein TERTU_2221 [Teredinibacter turnerae T7901]|uniref:Uncharacterized protein n=1 Tax=Teredinibacter turnerae (strain ATCC 39867 / T7901) TaxID=377629 RepID=C5BJJ7_TERTT|nr:hypothetical protein TERTU_2221 [Teredinibacter turnerae T7901]
MFLKRKTEVIRVLTAVSAVARPQVFNGLPVCTYFNALGL